MSAAATIRVALLSVVVVLGPFGMVVGKSPNDPHVSGSETALRYLDLEHPTIREVIGDSESAIEKARFVQVEISEVVNPRQYALEFEVSYVSAAGVKESLGMFSLYPADHPGSFIVAARGQVKAGGAIQVSLVVVDTVDLRAPLKVGIRSLALISGESPHTTS